MPNFTSSWRRPFSSEKNPEITSDASPSSVPGYESSNLHYLDAAAGAPRVGEQDLEENAKGGLGRHLGLLSTTALM